MQINRIYFSSLSNIRNISGICSPQCIKKCISSPQKKPYLRNENNHLCDRCPKYKKTRSQQILQRHLPVKCVRYDYTQDAQNRDVVDTHTDIMGVVERRNRNLNINIT